MYFFLISYVLTLANVSLTIEPAVNCEELLKSNEKTKVIIDHWGSLVLTHVLSQPLAPPGCEMLGVTSKGWGNKVSCNSHSLGAYKYNIVGKTKKPQLL